jgi:hypothetical protein
MTYGIDTGLDPYENTENQLDTTKEVETTEEDAYENEEIKESEQTAKKTSRSSSRRSKTKNNDEKANEATDSEIEQENGSKQGYLETNEYINFSKEEQFKEFKDIFQTSKISKQEFNSYVEKIMQDSTPERLSEEAQKIYGNSYQQKLKSFEEDTNHIFSDKEKIEINKMPAKFKMMLVRAVDAVQQQRDSIARKYGISGTTKALPQKTSADYAKDFNEVTRKLLKNEYRTADEFESLKKQRIDLASKLAK